MDNIRGRRLALLAALLGWLFDGLEMGLFPLVGRSALKELFGPAADEATIGRWFGVITAGFLVGAATGGVLFGWLGDRIGRVRAMTLSVLVYAGSSGCCAFAAEPWHLAGLRFFGALGMGGEWALGVALVMELWPDSSRAWLAAWIGAFGNLGYFVVGSVALALTQISNDIAPVLATVGITSETSDWLTRNGHWRLLMLLGSLPALLTFLIRIFVPESDKWEREKAGGRASHWSGYDLLAVLVGAGIASGIIALWAMDVPMYARIPATVAGLILVTVCYLHPVRQYLRRSGVEPSEGWRLTRRMLLGAGLSGVPLLATWAGVMWVYPWVDQLTEKKVPEARPIVQMASSLGAAIGCIAAALLGERFGRRPVYAALCVASGATLLGFFTLNKTFGWEFVASAGLLGAITASFYGWLPLYLPELFPTRLRATGQGFAFNFGRVLAAIGALQTGALLKVFDDDYAKACSVAAGVYVIGLIVIAAAPETRGRPLPD